MYWVQIAEMDTNQLAAEQPDEIASSEVPHADVPDITATRKWLDVEEEDHDVSDITQILKACLADVKKLRTVHSIKIIIKLTAIMEYVKLRESFRKHPKCKHPCLNASLAIARCMGKGKANGAYFACQIRQNKSYLLQHRHLPPTKKGAWNGQYMLLDNETVLQGVWVYLAAQNLGTITPLELCRHINEVILPALDLAEKNASISDRTAISWLKKLGYTCKDVKKGIYHDGHERPDVVEARKKFLEQIALYEW